MGICIENIQETCIALSILLLIATALYFKGLRHIIYRRINIIALTVWALGVALYIIGFNEKGSENNFLVLFLRASLSSIEMFASHSDLLEVGHHLQDNANYMLWFSLVHFLATVTTSIFIFNLFGIRIKNWWRKLILATKNEIKKIYGNVQNGEAKIDKTYIFWGINNESLSLAKNLKNGHDNIVFIVDNDASNNHQGDSGHHFSFSKLLGLSNSYDKEIEEIVETYKGVVHWKNNSFSLDSIKFLLSSETHILFLSDNEDDNIIQGSKVKSCNNFSNITFKYYCHAHRSLENRRITDSLGIELIDSSFLSILELKQNKDAHPVNFVELEKDDTDKNTGIVTSSFNAMILGFGDTGQEALSYLYEFSAFLGKDGNRSPYNITVLDRNIDSHKGNYIANRPALKTNPNINFIQTETGSQAYWDTVDLLISKGLNYVIIALGNDNLNLSTAIRLQEYRMRYTDDENTSQSGSRKFCIYVKQSQTINDKIEKLYNGTIKSFGTRENIFSKKYILNQEYKEEAKMYLEKYNKIGKYKVKTTEDNPYSIQYLRTRHRGDTQNLSNAYHRHTIIKLLGEDRIEELKKKYEYKRIPENAENFDGKYSYILTDIKQETDPLIKQKIEEEITFLFTNAAKCEHLRWNAAIEMLGYTQNKENRSSVNIITMQHNCLTSWDDLSNIWNESKDTNPYCEYKQYDFTVVETSINLYINSINKIQA